MEASAPGPIASFVAILPSIQSAVKVGGDGESRIQFDVSEQDIAEVMKLAAFGRQKPLRVTVTALENGGDQAYC